METVERDPRVDPRPGDEIRCVHIRRRVLGIWRGSGDVWFQTRGFGIRRRPTSQSLGLWRKWAATAEVIRKGII